MSEEKQSRSDAPFAIGLVLVLVLLVGSLAFRPGDRTDTTTTTEPTPDTAVLALNQPAPTFTANTLNGSSDSLANHSGEVILVNFWATWCPPCKAEMPDLNAYYQAHRDEGFTILAVNAREGESLVRPFIDNNNLTFPILMDPSGQIVNQYQIRSFPTSIIIDRSGVVRHIQVGIITPAQLEHIVTPLLQS